MTRITNPVAAALLVACSSGGVAAQNQVNDCQRVGGMNCYNPNQVDDAPIQQPYEGLRGELDSALAALKTAKSEEREALREVS